MRQIRFRAKRVDNGEWVKNGALLTFDTRKGEKLQFIPEKGAYAHAYIDDDGNLTELDGTFYQIDPDTAGQFIGEQDADGNDIYEGDIVQHGNKRYVIRFFDHYARFGGKNKSSICAVFPFGNCTILGNIHDNPELMEGFM